MSHPLSDERTQYAMASEGAAAADIDPFQPIATTAPPSQIPSRNDHPVPRLNIVSLTQHCKNITICQVERRQKVTDSHARVLNQHHFKPTSSTPICTSAARRMQRFCILTPLRGARDLGLQAAGDWPYRTLRPVNVHSASQMTRFPEVRSLSTSTLWASSRYASLRRNLEKILR